MAAGVLGYDAVHSSVVCGTDSPLEHRCYFVLVVLLLSTWYVLILLSI